MEALIYQDIRTQLTDRRQQLQKAITQYNRPPNLINLLREVDRALEKLNNNNYGLCEVCHDPVETDRLLADPLVRFCLDHLTAEEQHSLERDLALANHIQRSLLPKQQFESQYWDTYYHYEPAGMVSGDYCDLMQLPDDDGSFLFILGDVSGKGVAASLLMTQLRAIFHTLFALNTPLNQLLAQANHMFCESTLASQYATLICGKTNKTGNVEITIAGHPPVLLKRQNEILKLEASGLPLGLFCDQEYESKKIAMEPGDVLFLYSDGLNETLHAGEEYGIDRIFHLASQTTAINPRQIVELYLNDWSTYLGGQNKTDDITLLAIQRK